MSTTTQSTPTVYLATPRGTLCPKVVTQGWLNADPERHVTLAEIALATNATLPNDDGYCYAVLMQVVDAIQDSGALVTQYRNDDGIVTARVLFPESATVTKDRHLTFRAFCTARKQYRTFRCDRVLDCHAFSLPGEVAA